MKIEAALVGGGLRPGIDGPQDEPPFPGIDVAFEDNGVPYPPAIAPGQGPAGHRAPPVLEKGLFLVLGQDVFGVDLEILAHRVRGEDGEELLFVFIDAAEPAAVNHRLDPGQALELGEIGHG